MPKYFFNIRSHDDNNIIDEEGVDLPDLETVDSMVDRHLR